MKGESILAMDQYLGLIGKGVLEFSHETVIIPLMIVGYIWGDRKNFFHAICLVLTSVVFNATLKSIFQVPLSPVLSIEGFAFPSGHMQTSMALYGFLYTCTKNTVVKIGLISLLMMIGFSLMYFGYHNIYDILGAVFFALLLIFAYKLLRRKTSEYVLLAIIIVFVSMCLLFVKLIYKISPHLWMSYYALLGLVVSEYYFQRQGVDNHLKKKQLVATLLCCSFLVLLNTMFVLKCNILSVLQPLRWFFIGFFIPFSVFLSNVICCQRNC
jgi:undecaprenyl-diphosphatase